MAYFNVLIEGSGIDIADEEGSHIRGFFVNRIVKAGDKAMAAVAATKKVEEEWRTGRLVKHGAAPLLKVEEVNELSLFERLKSSDSGYVFHPGE